MSLKAHAGNQSETLCVSWDRGPGELSGYLLSLYNPNGSQQARMQLGSEANEVVLSDLVPGRLYRAEVLSLSGELSNGASTLGRTGERPLPPPVCLRSGDLTKLNKLSVGSSSCSSSSAPSPSTSFLFRGVTNTSLELTWSGPINSDYDDFDLQWTPRDRLSVINPYQSRTSGSRILKGMFPGRLYTFSLRTVSGATGPRALSTYSTAIHINIRTSRWQHCAQKHMCFICV